MHPMYRDRDLSPRRKLGPAVLHKAKSQDRLIEELQDRLGIAKQEQDEWKSQDDWLTEGVVFTARPQGEEQNGGQQVEKVEGRDVLGNSSMSLCPNSVVCQCTLSVCMSFQHEKQH